MSPFPHRSPLRAAIIGYGVSGRLSHAYGLRANPQFTITAVCDTADANRRRAAEELGCAVYTDYREMLAREPLDLVSVVTRSDLHCRMACDCLEAGVHTLVTKPWVLDSEEANRLLAVHRSSGKQLFPWIPMYWSPDYIRIRELLARKAIGDIFMIRRHHSDFRRRSDWQTERRFGGGYLLNWAMHILQPVLALAGSRVERVYGQLLQTVNPGDAEDNFLAVLEFADGIRGVAEFTEAVGGLPGFMIQGTCGTILGHADKVVLLEKDPGSDEPPRETVFPLEGKVFGDEADVYRDVAAALLDSKPFPVTPETAAYGTAVIDAVRASHESRQIITLAKT